MLNRRMIEAAFGAILLSTTIQSNAHAATFLPGDFITYSQDSWGGDPATSTAAARVVGQFDFVHSGGVIEAGLSSAAGFSMVFTSASDILDYLPATGVTGPLASDRLDPTSSAAGVFGGYVVALRLNIDFPDAGHFSGIAPLAFGDLRVGGLTTTSAYNHLTIREFLSTAANPPLGFAFPLPYPIDDIAQPW